MIDESAFIHEAAVVLGDVSLGARVSIWPGAVVRAELAPVVIGADTNVQDGTIIHVDEGVPCTIGARVGIGHGAIIHGATIEDDVLVAMGAILLNNVYVGSGSIIGAGAVLTEAKEIPPNSLVLGVPGRVVRQTTGEERLRIRKTCEAYIELQKAHREGKVKRHR